MYFDTLFDTSRHNREMALEFSDSRYERCFAAHFVRDLHTLDSVARCCEIALMTILWVKQFQHEDHWIRFTGLAAMSLNSWFCLGLLLAERYAAWKHATWPGRYPEEPKLYINWRDTSFSLHKLFLFLHILGTHKFVVVNLGSEALSFFGGGWFVSAVHALVFRQRFSQHIYVQLALMTALLCSNKYLYMDVAASAAVSEEGQCAPDGHPLRRVSPLLPPPWPGFRENSTNYFVKYWSTAQVLGAFLLPTILLYSWELEARREFMRTNLGMCHDEILRFQSLEKVVPWLLLAATTVVVIWYCPELTLWIL